MLERRSADLQVTATTLVLFLLMALIWGATWVAMKAGVTAVPPIFFAAVRYVLAAAVLACVVRNWTAPLGHGFAGRTVWTGLLINAATYALLFWGMQFVTSGVASLINLSLVPIGLFALSVLVGEERASWRHTLAIALGAAGLAVLFWNRAGLSGTSGELWGAVAIVAGTFCYCLGTVLSRPLLAIFAPLQLTAAQALVGAAGLLAVTALLEPVSMETLSALARPAPLISLVFLAILGTVIAYSIYLRLVRDWGASKAGLYPFISPMVALALGWLVYSEEVGWVHLAGAILMLGGAAVAMPPERPAKS